MKEFHHGLTWNSALEYLERGFIATRIDSVWKGQEMRIDPVTGQFQHRRYVEWHEVGQGNEHWTEWEPSVRHTYRANQKAKDWMVREAE